MQEYVAAKANIFTHQSANDIAVFNAGQWGHGDTMAAKALGEVRWFSRQRRGGQRRLSAGNRRGGPRLMSRAW